MSNTTTKNILLSQSKIGQPTEAGTRVLVHEILTEDDRLLVNVEVPGVDPTVIDVHCDSTMLHVECERGALSLPIDSGLDTADIEAEVKWGLLTLLVPRRAARAVKVKIHDQVQTQKRSAPAKFTSEE